MIVGGAGGPGIVGPAVVYFVGDCRTHATCLVGGPEMVSFLCASDPSASAIWLCPGALCVMK